jgi:hypothetical protein
LVKGGDKCPVREAEHCVSDSVMQCEFTYTIETGLTAELQNCRDEIRALVRGNAREGKHENDADNILELYEYGGGYFVTTDDRLLSLSEQLFSRYFVTTIKPCAYEAIL